MIEKLELKNYRCFADTTIRFKEISVLVGKNNAGKSTLIEALRMVSIALSKYCHTTYGDLPSEFGLPLRDRGFRLDVERYKIDLRGIVYRYGDGYASLKAYFDNGCALTVYANTEIVYAVIYGNDGKSIKNKSQAAKLSIKKVSILPQIGLIKENEKRLMDDTVEKDKETYLSSRHFRNELLKYKDQYWDVFVELATQTWHGLRINSIDYLVADNLVRLFVSDTDFTAEIGFMGSGLQMWLQIIWFLARTSDSTTVILDEPDVYMHPDLQRKLIRLVQYRYPQVIISTHSVEIISEVEPRSILTVDKNAKHLKYASDLQAVQNMIDEMGEISNLSLARLGIARKCVFVEGDDLKLLSKIAEAIGKKRFDSLESLPCVPVGGFNNLREAYGMSKLLKKETNGSIECICILDRDYYPDDLIAKKHEEAEKNHLKLHVWKRKEIENYLLEPEVLFRLSGLSKDMYNSFVEKYEKLVNKMKDYVFDQMAQDIAKNKKGNTSEANKIARRYLNCHWKCLDDKLKIIGGKKLLKEINKWFRNEYNIHLSTTRIISEYKPDEFDPEIIEVINMLI